ncbi:MAG: phenylalanine--tRNA ligase subunit alpha [candidate division Zixibacteria bacterium]|nr:phenylalanine--tRNA ligase subunit alpha [candidate division Zixibacteria bacterium]MBU1471364.1 phenylalanine--tRNA ligase subunit alpha [candidate division Zixibacteria bacterium]MBU2625481.1 phenylalanine--tRNA ligase subunit alpha [candidate division Zixibacteria bacterium]
MSAKEDILSIREQFNLAAASVDSEGAINELRVRYLGRKSNLTAVLRGLKDLPPEEKKEVGKLANSVRIELEASLAAMLDSIQSASKKPGDVFDYTLPGRTRKLGRLHPITRTIEDISRIFYGMGFEVAVGPDVEEDYYNFEALNIPKDHPARDMQDTFYINDDVVLRTHTSPVQIRTMKSQDPPVRIIAPGKCYRNEAISARSNAVFHQIEGLYIDVGVTFADLKGVLNVFVKEYFGEDVKMRLRANYFPFTEPSAEVDISCFLCGAKGCPLCKQTGWLEILGCGMVDPAVFEAVGYDPEKYTGYAFGMGIERICMLKYRIQDIRRFYENDLRLLEQFL